MHGAAVMVNLLGDLWRGESRNGNEVLRHPNVKLHLYGKLQRGPGAKWGTLQSLTETAEAALQLALEIKQSLER